MASREQEVTDDDNDETLAANFGRLMGGRSVAKMRADMAAAGLTIGSGAIQKAKAGWRGLRLGTLQKFADYFGCSVSELLRSEAEAGAWPFRRLSPDAYRLASDEIKDEAEAMLARSAKRAQSGELPGSTRPAESAKRA